MVEINNPHDHFFKEVMSQIDLAAEFLSLYLPTEVAELLDFSSLTTCKEVFVDAELQEHLSDLLYRVRVKTGQEIYVHLLLEHKSSPDKWVNLQILRYQTLLWHELQRSGVKELPFIVPVVCYHGRARWRVPQNFSALFGKHLELAALSQFTPEFRYHLFDLANYQNAELSGQPALQTVLRLLKYALRKPQLRQELVPIWGLALTSDFPQSRFDDFVEVCSNYLEKGAKLPKTDITQAFSAAARERGGSNMEGFFESWRKQGRQEGLQEGRQQGLQQGLHQEAERLALKALGKCFGVLPLDFAGQAAQLSVEDLETLTLDAADFASLDELQNWLNQRARQEIVN